MSTNVNAPAKEKNKLGSLVKAFKPYYAPFIISIILLITFMIAHYRGKLAALKKELTVAHS